MRSGESSHPLQPQSEVLWFLSAWQTVRVRTGQAANQLRFFDSSTRCPCDSLSFLRIRHLPDPAFDVETGALTWEGQPFERNDPILGVDD
jgi:hypothetical protein